MFFVPFGTKCLSAYWSANSMLSLALPKRKDAVVSRWHWSSGCMCTCIIIARSKNSSEGHVQANRHDQQPYNAARTKGGRTPSTPVYAEHNDRLMRDEIKGKTAMVNHSRGMSFQAMFAKLIVGRIVNTPSKLRDKELSTSIRVNKNFACFSHSLSGSLSTIREYISCHTEPTGHAKPGPCQS